MTPLNRVILARNELVTSPGERFLRARGFSGPMATHFGARIWRQAETIDYCHEGNQSGKTKGDAEIADRQRAAVCRMKQTGKAQRDRAEGNAQAKCHLLNHTRQGARCT